MARGRRWRRMVTIWRHRSAPPASRARGWRRNPRPSNILPPSSAGRTREDNSEPDGPICPGAGALALGGAGGLGGGRGGGGGPGAGHAGPAQHPGRQRAARPRPPGPRTCSPGGSAGRSASSSRSPSRPRRSFDAAGTAAPCSTPCSPRLRRQAVRPRAGLLPLHRRHHVPQPRPPVHLRHRRARGHPGRQRRRAGACRCARWCRRPWRACPTARATARWSPAGRRSTSTCARW